MRAIARLREALLAFAEYNEGEPCWCPRDWWDDPQRVLDNDGEHSDACANARAALAEESA